MAKQTVNPGETGAVIRGKINDNFTELYNRNDFTTAEKNKLQALTDDLEFVDNYAALPTTGVSGVAYVTNDDGKMFRWNGSAYVEISAGMTSQQVADLLAATPRLNVAFVPATGIQLDRDTWYNSYTKSGALEITIAAGSVIGKGAQLPIVTDGTPPTITGATQHPSNSNSASTTAGDTDEYIFWKTETGIYYAINNLGQ